MSITFGQWVRQRRKELDLTQQELVTRLGRTDRSYISKIEHDQSKQPSGALLVQIAHALDSSLETLLDETGLRDSYNAETSIPPLSDGAQLLVSAVNTRYPHLTRDQANQAMRFLGAVAGEPPPETAGGAQTQDLADEHAARQ